MTTTTNTINNELSTEVVVLGAGPGGYAAAFRAADLGKKVVLIERQEIGGVCLNVGCIPSKTLLHLAKVVDEAALVEAHGITFTKPNINIEKMRGWKNSVIRRLTTGLRGLAKRRKVELVMGTGKFISPTQIEVITHTATQQAGATQTGTKTIVNFQQAIIAAGSQPINLSFMPHGDKRIMDSTAALEINDIPQELLVVGGGVIGLEMATVYQSFGSKITIVEFMDQILPGTDKDIVKPLHQALIKKGAKILLNTKVTAVDAKDDGLWTTFTSAASATQVANQPGADQPGQTQQQRFDRILLTVGRRPCGKEIGAEEVGVKVDDKGFIPVDKKLRTNLAHIYAIGDIIGNPMLAHKAATEGRLAAEIIAGHNKECDFTASDIPAIVYTDPEVATVGLNETELQRHGVKYGKGVFPWMANGRSQSLNRQEGITKLLFDAETHRLLGAAIVGPNAGDLISEAALALKMRCTAHDIASTVHPHPTLSETIAMAAEVFEGTATDL
jgi:dihydrolipoamide dehydrogenase